ncbi:MAG TPA: aminotransferase class I/II-fold pyridoxal phosphate-dependent enzyme [Gemmatimonadaceae bacterium]
MGHLRLSSLTGSLLGSEILKIAADVRELDAQGVEICNLTVGDFAPSEFRIPGEVEQGIIDRLRKGETNYPPAEGILALREAVRTLYQRELGLDPSLASVIVTSGSRPGIYATYRTVVDPGDRVVYPTPSWNNPYYVQLVGAVGVPVPVGPESRFMPTRELLKDAVRDARLLVLCSPQNPAGTMFTEQSLGAICDLVLEENARRSATERPLYVMYDQVYWTLTLEGQRHVHPVQVRPAMAPYTIYIDGASKSLAATGIRVGWVVAPEDLAGPMSALIGHMGAWAPKAEQGAVADFLENGGAWSAFRDDMVARVRERLDALYSGLCRLRDEGLPVNAISPEGAIYLSAQFALRGRTTPDGARLDGDEAVRAYLLRAAGLAVVPLRAFGSEEDTEWFRLSVGAVSPEEIEKVLPKVRSALQAVKR